jgi:hypothetical protein
MLDPLVQIGAVMILIGGFAHMMVRSYREEQQANRRDSTQLRESQIRVNNWRLVQSVALGLGAFTGIAKIIAMFYAP